MNVADFRCRRTTFGRVTSIRTPGGGLTGARLAQIGLKFLF
jgi:hypothetical protein